MEINEFILKNVRCFAGEQRIKLAPLTFLVGENSTGKTTTLGCLHTILNKVNSTSESYNFNQSPYELGTFTEIARISIESFELGYTHQSYHLIHPITEYYTFKNIEDEPVVTQTRYVLSDGEVVVNYDNRRAPDTHELWIPFNIKAASIQPLPFSIKQEGNNFFIQHRYSVNHAIGMSFQLTDMLYYLIVNARVNQTASAKEKNLVQELINLVYKSLTDSAKKQTMDTLIMSTTPWSLINNPPVISVAPIRSQPKRTYDPIRSTETPEGDDVPIYLMRLKRQGDTQNIFKSLQKFGRASGLFTAIDVKTFSENMSDPFQIQVKVRGVQSNLSDVGYGISQLLPILVRVFADKRHSTMLLQQPEVHLHPQAQAELSSLFISAIKQNQQSFVIETHSDAMIDRARIEIMRGKIKPEDVSLVYFEPKGQSVKIHNIGYDEDGNLLNVPQGYRDFFMDEGNRLLGFDE